MQVGWDPAVFQVLAFLVVLYVSISYGRREGLDVRVVYWMSVSGIVGAVWGGHVFYLLWFPGRILSDPLLLFRLDGPAGVFGAFVGAAAFAGTFLRLRGIAVRPYADAVVPAVALGYAIVRIGCFFQGDDFGALADVPWAVQFPAGSPAFEHHVAAGWVSAGDASSRPVHPTQLYHAAAGVALFGLLARWQVEKPGERLVMAMAAYGVLRFTIEFFRGDNLPVLFGLHTSHLLSLFFLAAAGSLWWRWLSRSRSSETNLSIA